MTQSKSGPPPIVYILALLLLGGGGYYWYTNQGKLPSVSLPGNSTASPATTTAPAIPLPDTLPAGSSVRIDGSTSLARFNKRLGEAFVKQYPGVNYSWKANGSGKGITALMQGEVDVAASSRPLSGDEQLKGLIAVPVKNDSIAILVGKANPFTGGLTTDQLRDIFTGKITNWSQVGGPPLPLRVVNRNPSSGTYRLFADAVLGGADFGTGSHFTTMSKDVTTELLQRLGTNGIGYANYSEIESQKTIRALPLDGQTPGTDSYALVSTLYYVYKPDASEAAKALVAYATGPAGKAIAASN
ncbi:phosphate ABC transporter substrate-binding protein [Anthocerotibacter panamensis]|uniref:phosphate ABC transporter substrate-binding protein n=1 Tax=Anthocerotibacter panamensis TaxID=2857077 RepID=UPI001C401647|nr:phosphate ABC transporter substrate-binding protein [Anthocerotibacter panamensis]